MTIPNHIAIIMDGNGRWAKARGLSRNEGHLAGSKNVVTLCNFAYAAGVKHMTMYAFSTENWKRSPLEVAGLMHLLASFIDEQETWILENKIGFRAIGQLDRLPFLVRRKIKLLIKKTELYTEHILCFALSYGSRDEITSAVKLIAKSCIDGKLDPENITEQTVSNHLFQPDIPDPDLMIRTSGECRLSNFLLWQLAYSEFMFVPETFPDFSTDLFNQCLEKFNQRERRFGNA